MQGAAVQSNAMQCKARRILSKHISDSDTAIDAIQSKAKLGKAIQCNTLPRKSEQSKATKPATLSNSINATQCDAIQSDAKQSNAKLCDAK